jgi:hypothetical protein
MGVQITHKLVNHGLSFSIKGVQITHKLVNHGLGTELTKAKAEPITIKLDMDK